MSRFAYATRSFTSTAAARAAVSPAAAKAGVLDELTLSLALPHRSLVANKAVLRVTVPGKDGVLGIEKNSPPLLSELKAGVIRVDYKDNTSEEFFVPGGFAFKHANNKMDVSAPEGVKLENVDVDVLRKEAGEAAKELAAAAPGSKPYAEARLALDLYKVLGQAVKITV